MSVHRIARYQAEDPFTRIPNAAVRDPDLDLKALGLLVVMLSKPDGWRFTERNLAAEAGVGRAQLRSAMASLIDAGYVVRRHDPNPDGGPPTLVTEVYDTKLAQGPVSEPSGGSDPSTVGIPEGRETEPPSNDVVLETTERASTTDGSSEPTDDELPRHKRDPVEVWPSETVATCREVARLIRGNGYPLPSSGTANADRWYEEADRLLRIGPPGADGAADLVPSAAEVLEVARWALTVDDFWPANLRSWPKFREKYPQLRANWRRAGRTNGHRSGADLRARAQQLREAGR